jgi:serine/threonine-protein kinase
MDASLPPDCAARYRVRKLIASGGFGTVYAATQVRLHRTVALKVLSPHALADAEQVRRFESEARVTAALSNPNVVQILDYGAEHGVPWIAYELLAGGSLRDRLARDRYVPLGEALAMGAQVASALACAHAEHVLHRDIKPENVLLADSGAWKVADFGIARWAGSGLTTATGLVLGTPAYMAPELIREAPEPASDVYALGAMLHELISGHPPFEGEPLRIIGRYGPCLSPTRIVGAVVVQRPVARTCGSCQSVKARM